MTAPAMSTVEAAARALYLRCAAEDEYGRITPWPLVHATRREAYRRIARVVLDAAAIANDGGWILERAR